MNNFTFQNCLPPMTASAGPSLPGRAIRRALLAAIACIAAWPALQARAGEVEVLHYWTSGGEARALDTLKRAVQERGNRWKDFAITGGGGDWAMSMLKSRVLAGNPPAAAQIKGPAIQEWAQLGVLANLDSLAQDERWDSLLPKVVADTMKYKGSYVAAPVNVHRVNWMWVNPGVLQRAGVAEAPRTWDEFFIAADKIAAAGLIPLAHGGQNWQDFTMFETVVLGTAGASFYQEAFVQLSPAALTSDTMRNALEVFRRLKRYTDAGSTGRDWNATTAMVMDGKAAFQFMGDWAKGEFIAAGKVPGKDFLCIAAPGSANAFTFNIDSFAMFKLKSPEAQKAQGYLASAMMSQDFQEAFNLAKGSIPARQQMKMNKFDICAKASERDFVSAAKNGRLVPSVSQGMAVPPAVEAAFKDIIGRYWNDDRITADAAAKAMLDASRKK
jgi:glucose/mannose transport system substrate-binding protein